MIRSLLLSLMLSITTTSIFLVPATQAAQPTQTQTVILDIPGMTCKFCPITVRKALQKVPGVIEAKSEYDTKTATVTFDPDKTTVEALTRATENAGYKSVLRK